MCTAYCTYVLPRSTWSGNLSRLIIQEHRSATSSLWVQARPRSLPHCSRFFSAMAALWSRRLVAHGSSPRHWILSTIPFSWIPEPPHSAPQVVPTALLEMSRSVMRERFSSLVTKPVYTFVFERKTIVTQALYDKLVRAKETRAVVVSHPTAIKSFVLKFAEVRGLSIIETRLSSDHLKIRLMVWQYCIIPCASRISCIALLVLHFFTVTHFHTHSHIDHGYS